MVRVSRRALEVFDPELVCADGFDDCIMGVIERIGMPAVVLYDREAMLRKLTRNDGLTREDAVEHYDFNILGSYVGEKTPAFFIDIRHLEYRRIRKPTGNRKARKSRRTRK